MSNTGRRRNRKSPGCLIPRRIGVEALEGRLLLTTFTVTNTGDSGAGSLRAAITGSNGSSVSLPNTIAFSIGSGVQTITPTSPLPSITEPTILDGATQPGYAGTPLIQVNGTNAGAGADGIVLAAGSNGSTVKSLSVIHFGGSGIHFTASSGNQAEANFIGLAADGITPAGDNTGVFIDVSATNNSIGGAGANQGNTISGNTQAGVFLLGAGTSNNVVVGDRIGTDVTGTIAVPNQVGVDIGGGATANTIGGTVTGDLISGNFTDGVLITDPGTTGNVVVGVFIGTVAGGMAPLPNATGVVIQNGASANRIGIGSTGDLISGNTQDGINISDVGTSGNSVAGVLIGLAADGKTPIPNSNGVVITLGASANTIGGTAGGDVISDNTQVGVDITFGSSANVVEGDFVGTQADGKTPAPNGTGVYLQGAATGNTVGGTVAGSRNIISGNTAFGVDIAMAGTSGNVVEGDYIGLASDGRTLAGNGAGYGVQINGGLNNTIGGTTLAAGDVISGNGAVVSGVQTGGGIEIVGGGSLANVVEGDIIGLAADGITPDGNITGVIVHGGATANTIGGTVAGALDVISDNTNGVTLSDAGTSSNVVEGDYIGTALDGITPVGNIVGVYVVNGATGDTIGGTSAGARDVISGNTNSLGVGIYIYNVGAPGDVVEGDTIGLGANGLTGPGNRTGILLGANASALASGITIGGTAAGAGNVISGNIGNGITLNFGDADLVAGNVIGLAANGTTKAPNQLGILVAAGATTPTIGGTTAAARDVISGNTTYGISIGAPGVLVEGDEIGTDVLGLAGPGNGQSGVFINPGPINGRETIGGTTAGSGDVVSGNGGDGVDINSSFGNVVEGDIIGLANGLFADGNAGSGVFVNAGPFTGLNTIGGTVGMARDVISGNAVDGILIDAASGGGDVIEGDYIGLATNGFTARGNATGVFVGATTLGVMIGGTTLAAQDVISGNTANGVDIEGGSADQVVGDIIGMDSLGSTPRPNATGVKIGTASSSITVGGTVAGTLDLISGNSGDGVLITDLGTKNNLVEGDYIGTAKDGTTAVPNGTGVALEAGATANTIGGTVAAALDVISGNTDFGVDIVDVVGMTALTDPGTLNNLVEGDYIGLASDGQTPVDTAGHGVGIQILGTKSASFTGTIRGASGNTIGGTGTGAADVISGNTDGGIEILGAIALDNVVEGNFIGLAAGGMTPVGNGVDEILIAQGASGNTIGGTTTIGSATPGARNVIDGSAVGVEINGAGATGNVVAGNYIGLGFDGLAALGNSTGVLVDGGASNDTIGGPTPFGGTMMLGGGNVIASNLSDGVDVQGGSGIVVEGNLIGLAADGLTPRDNSTGVLLEQGTTGDTVGGTAAGAGDVISGNFEGVEVQASSGVVVAGDFIGLATDLKRAAGNRIGVFVQGAAALTIGGTSAGARDVISGNSTGVEVSATTGVVVEGSTIGLAADGLTAVPNMLGVDLVIGSGNVTNVLIGGTAAGAGNVISGNSQDGILDQDTSSLVVQGNFIGLAADGMTVRGNANGVQLGFGAGQTVVGDTIGGTALGAGNVISGNTIGIDAAFTTIDLIAGNVIGLAAVGGGVAGNATGILLANVSGLIGNASGNINIGGTTASATNVISGNGIGVDIEGGRSNSVLGDIIGLGADGITPAANTIGVMVGGTATGVTIGGTSAGARDIISNNATGVSIQGGSGDVVEGDYIGLGADGAALVGNNTGIAIGSGATGITIGGTTAGARDVISDNTSAGVDIEGGSGDVVEGDTIGLSSTGFILTNASGTAVLGNPVGVMLGPGTTLVTIGGTTPGARDVISNNSNGITIEGPGTTGNVVEGDTIGLAADGLTAVPNVIGVNLILGTANDTIGGSVAGAGNLISGNSQDGILTDNATSLVVQGNFIGLAADGKTPAGNGVGIGVLTGASLVTIGGTSAGARNVISANGDGVDINSASEVLIEGDFFGTASDGTALSKATNPGISSTSADVRIFAGSSGVTIGGTTASARDVIANAGSGVDDEGGSGDLIEGDFIGLAADGRTAIGNNYGVVIGSGTTGDTVGGTAAGSANVISGNFLAGIAVNVGSGNLVIGNLIGLAADGSTMVGNGTGFQLGPGTSNVTIGGTSTGAGNVISGNATGLTISGGSNITVVGLVIGLTLDGKAAAPNGSGISIVNATGVTIGGTTAAARDVISGNPNGAGVSIQGGSGIVVEGDYIGLAADGLTPTGGGLGISVNSASNVTIGGTTAAARDVISGNPNGAGVSIQGGSGIVVEGDYIGLAADGLTPTGGGLGVSVNSASNVTIGGATAAARDVISGNKGDGVFITGAGTSGVVVEGDYIGLAADGLTLAPNANGVEVSGGPSGVLIGGATAAARDVISGNTAYGVDISVASGNVVAGDYIGLAADGLTARPNVAAGVRVGDGSKANTIGGTAPGDGDVIASNADPDVQITGAGTSGNLVTGDFIGLAADGLTAVGNRTAIGVLVDSGASANVIGGTSAVDRDVISGELIGVELTGSGTSGNLVEGDTIGLAADGKTPAPNSVGVLISGGASSNTIGGVVAGSVDVISKNLGDGVDITGTGTSGNAVAGDIIGLDASNTIPSGNGGYGIRVDGGSAGDVIGGTVAGATDIIAYNGAAGVLASGPGTVGVSILGNSITQNGGSGIVLSNGANPGAPSTMLLNASTSGSRTLVGGSIAGSPGAYLVELFGNPGLDSPSTAQGRDFLGRLMVQVGPGGSATFSIAIASGHGFFTATATATSGDTSAFSTPLLQTDLTVAQSTSPSTVRPGQPFSYQVTVGNGGPYSAQGVVVTDTLPSAIATASPVVTVTGVAGATSTIAGGVLKVILPSLPIGGSALISIQFAKAPANTLLKNSVSVDVGSGVANASPTDNISVLQTYVGPTGPSRPTYVIGPVTSVSTGLVTIALQVNGVDQSPLMASPGDALTINGAGANDLFMVDLGTPANDQALAMSASLTIRPGGGGSLFVFSEIPDVPGLDVLAAGLTSADDLTFPQPVDPGLEVFATFDPASGQTRLSTGSGSGVSAAADSTGGAPFAFQGSPTLGPIVAPGGVGLVGSAGVAQIGVTGTASGRSTATFGPGSTGLDFFAPTVTVTGQSDTHSYSVAPLPGGGGGVAITVEGQGADQLVLVDQGSAGNAVDLQDGPQAGPTAPGMLGYTGIGSITLATKAKGSKRDSLSFANLFPSTAVDVAVGPTGSRVAGPAQLAIAGDAVGNNLEVDSMAPGQSVVVDVRAGLPAKTQQSVAVVGQAANPGILDLRTNRSTEQVIFVPYPEFDSGVFVIQTRDGRLFSVAYTNMTPELNGVPEHVPAKQPTKPAKKHAPKVQHTQPKHVPAGPHAPKAKPAHH